MIMIRMSGLVELRPINKVPVNSKTSIEENIPTSNRDVMSGKSLPEEAFEDHEAPMARAQLMNIHKQSAELFNMIGEDEDLEGWVQHKLSLAADYINAVHSNMQYEKSNASTLGDGSGAPADAPLSIFK
jgi:hypothetical protein